MKTGCDTKGAHLAGGGEPALPAQGHLREATMTRILFFGRVGERLGREGQLDLPANGLPIGEIRRLLAKRDAMAADALLRPDVRACVDLTLVDEDAVARPDQEIAFFSLFSGG